MNESGVRLNRWRVTLKPDSPRNKRWTMGLGLMLLACGLWMSSGCAPHSIPSLDVKPPITIAPKVDDVHSFQEWVGGIYNAGWLNCRTLSRLRAEDPGQCDDPKIITDQQESPK